MHLSHSGLQQILTCPASYFLSKKEGIVLKKEPRALQIGSAFHWGCEHNTDNLDEYLASLDRAIKEDQEFKKDFILAKGMIRAYLNKKPQLFREILTDYNKFEVLNLLDEQHELDVTVPLKSYQFKEDHEFHAIIDLLLLTDKGFIVLDYKTSTQTPDFDKYLDQVLRYVYVIKKLFPDIPVYKVGIINVKKVQLRKKERENDENYLLRIQKEYDINDDDLVTYHEFSQSDFSEDKLTLYIENLSRMCDFAQMIDDNHYWFINYGNAVSIYGKSEFWNYFYKTKDAFYLYKIYDPMFNPEFNEMSDYRDCIPLDMEALETTNLLNHFERFYSFIMTLPEDDIINKEKVFEHCKKNFRTDDMLLERYWSEFERRVNSESGLEN